MTTVTALLTLIDAAGMVSTTVTDGDGRYELHDLAPGPCTVTASVYAPVATHVELRGRRTDHDILLVRPATGSPRHTEGFTGEDGWVR